MTTIVAVKKDGFAAIAADSLTSWGNVTESARHIANHHKIVKYGDNYFAFAGSSAFKVIFAHWLSKLEHELSFDNVQNIFESWLEFHHQLKDEYYLREFDNDDDQFESSRASILVANPHGIFSVTSLRAVVEYNTFTSFGSGFDLAIGAMAALYDRENETAETIARKAIEVAAEFDDGTALPLQCISIRLK